MPAIFLSPWFFTQTARAKRHRPRFRGSRSARCCSALQGAHSSSGRRFTWETLLHVVALISFVDNDAPRHSVISGYSPSLASSTLISETACWDAKLGVFAWTARVPSASNIADGPSRLDCSPVRAMGAAEAQMLGATGSPIDWQMLGQATQGGRGVGLMWQDLEVPR